MGEIFPWPTPPEPMPLTGERLTSEYGGQTQIEHLHRYLLAREWCRDKDILDVASGEGYGTALLAQVARSATGVEIDSAAVTHAAKSYVRGNLDFRRGDARSLPLPDACVDVVVSFETIEHFAEHDRFLDEVRRVLRPKGLFVVSTPDRDNYSLPDVPANPYHIKEMTGAEFKALLLNRFDTVSVLLQRPVFGSVMLPTAAETVTPLSFERRGNTHFEASMGLARPQYLVAFASDGPTVPLPSSVYVDTARLGMLSPPEAAAQLQTARASEAAERARAESMAAEMARAESMATAESNQLRAHVFSTVAALEECRRELATARGEAKGLLAANEMAERACAALRDELFQSRGAEAAARRELLGTHDQAQWARSVMTESARRAEAALANTLASHSWRLTAPMRRIRQILYPRP